MPVMSFRSIVSVVFSGALIISSLGTASQAATINASTSTAVAANGNANVTLESAGTIIAPEFNGSRSGNNGLLFSPDGDFLYAQTYGYLLKVDLATFSVLERVNVSGQPEISTTSSDRQTGYIVTDSNNPVLHEFNLATGVVGPNTAALSGANSPQAIASGVVPTIGPATFVYSRGSNFYGANPSLHSVNGTTGAVTSVDLRSLLNIQRETFGVDVAVSADGSEVYLSWNNTIYVFNSVDLFAQGTPSFQTLQTSGSGLLKVHDDDTESSSNLGKLYALDSTTGMLRIIDPNLDSLVTQKQLTAEPKALAVRSNGDAAASYYNPIIDYLDLSTDTVVSTTFPLVGNNGAFALAIAMDENVTFGTCIFTANNYDSSFSAISVDGADCGPFQNRFDSIAATIEVNGSATLNISPPTIASRENPWVGVGIFVDGVLDRVVKPPFGASINLSWAELAPGSNVSIRSYSQANLDAAGLTSVDNVTSTTKYLHERTTRLAFLGLEASDIDAGDDHTCALVSGSVYCWGFNEDGQLGDATDAERYTATKVVASGDFTNTDVKQIVVANAFTCALENGSVYCWGGNSNGRVGSDTDGDPALVPTKVQSFSGGFQNSNVTQISASDRHACAITGGSVYCWGRNSNGQLGDGSTNSTSQATKVAAVQGVFANTSVTAVSAGDEHTCALSGGSAYCWGQNDDGELGDGTSDSSGSPVKVVNVSGGFTNTNVTALSAGDGFTCAIASGVAYCWGLDEFGKLGNGEDADDSSEPEKVINEPTSGFVNASISQISAGKDHTCAIKGGVMFCWGSNEDDQLGAALGDSESETPQKVGSVQGGFTNAGVTRMGIGSGHTCAIDSGKAYCWGEGGDGRLGNGSTDSNSVVSPDKVCCKVASVNPSTPPTPPAAAVTYNTVPKRVGPNTKFTPVKNANGRTLKLSSSTLKSCRVAGKQIVFVSPGTCRVKVNQGSTTLRTISTKVVAGVKPSGSVTRTSTSNIYFAGNSAVLSSTAKADLRKLASKLKSADVVTVSGHAAYTGFFSSRSFAKTLSEKRADATAKYLRSLGVKVTVKVSYGSSAQVSKTLSKNRRVEIGWL